MKPTMHQPTADMSSVFQVNISIQLISGKCDFIGNSEEGYLTEGKESYLSKERYFSRSLEEACCANRV
jgi:hypothetical protein